MKRWASALLIIGLIAAFTVRAGHRARAVLDPDLRDAVASDPPLSPGHAGLGRAGLSSCQACHKGTAPVRPVFMRWGGSAWEHSGPAAPDTATCLSCHDGTQASAASVHGPTSHPIGVDYAQAWRKSPERFNDITALRDIRLDNGKIGCLSCHAVHKLSDGGRKTVIESSCQSCHRL